MADEQGSLRYITGLCDSPQRLLLKRRILGNTAVPTFVLSLYDSGDSCMIHPLGHFHAPLVSVVLVLPPVRTIFL